MIIQIKPHCNSEKLKKIKDFLNEQKLEIKDLSTTEVLMFLVTGAIESIDLASLYAFEEIEQITPINKPYKLAAKINNEQTKIKLKNGVTIGGNEFVVMAGPCSIESEEQVQTILSNMARQGVKIVRGGVFKPRTSPYAFQGLGLEGLKLFRKIADQYDLAIVSELTSSSYLSEFVELADIIQIGARNMQNFELLKAVGKTKKPILLKRGMSATIEEWLMSAEYILAEGNPNVILCERGIRTFETYTRNTLDISSVLAIHNLSHLPVIVDPSHASGRYEMIEKLSLASLAVGANGIMVEVHQQPEKALSDGAQSLKLETFNQVLTKLNQVATALDRKIT